MSLNPLRIDRGARRLRRLLRAAAEIAAFVVLFMSVVRTGSAQDWQLDTVLLVSGGRLRGNVVEQDATTGVRLRLPDGTVRTIAPADVAKVERAGKPASTEPEPDVEESPAEPAVPEETAPPASNGACIFDEDCKNGLECVARVCKSVSVSQGRAKPAVLVLTDIGLGATGLFSAATAGALETNLNVALGLPAGPIHLGIAGQFRLFYLVDAELEVFGGMAGLFVDGEVTEGLHLGGVLGGMGIEADDRAGGPSATIHALYALSSSSPYRFYFGARTGAGAVFSIRDPIGIMTIDAVAGMMVQ